MQEKFLEILEFCFDVYDACTLWVIDMLTFKLDDRKSVLYASATIAEKINDDVVKPIAISIITICFLISFLKILNKEDIVRNETYAKIFFLMCFSKSAVNYSFSFCKRIYNKGTEMILSVEDLYFQDRSEFTYHTYVQNKNEIVAALNKMSVLHWIVVLAISGIFTFLILIIPMIVTALSWGRYVEILVLMCGASLPMAFLPLEHEGKHIIKTYYKYFISVVLQGFAVVITMIICTKLTGSITLEFASKVNGIGSLFAILGNIFINAFVMIAAVMKSTQIAQKWIGQ